MTRTTSRHGSRFVNVTHTARFKTSGRVDLSAATVFVGTCILTLFLVGRLKGEALQRSRGQMLELPADRDGPSLVNWLMLGTHRDSVQRALRYERRRAEMVDSPVLVRNVRWCEYDEFQRWRLWGVRGNNSKPFSEDVCLFYKAGFLQRKCLVDRNDSGDWRVIFRDNILTGKQYPPADDELMKEVRWGECQAADFLVGKNGHAKSGRLRCGIVLDTRSVFARQYGYNVLVLLQNMGPCTIDDELLLVWLGSPKFRLFCNTVDPPELLSSQSLGALTTNMRSGVMTDLLNTPVGKEMFPEDSPERESLMKEPTAVSRFRMERCQYIYAWFKVEELAKGESLVAEFQARGTLDGLREWKARSGTLRLNRQQTGSGKPVR